MKKLLVSSFAVVALAILGTGCLKDKDYEDQRYGTQVQDARAVTFPAAKGASSVTYAVVSSTESQDLKGPFLALEAPGPQSSDVHITLQIDDALVTADPSLTVMPTSEYSFSLNRTIVAGQILDSIMINLPNSANLDPNLTYGIGVKIVSADNNFQVADNMKQLLLKFTIKNKYDGVYEAVEGLTSTTGGYVDNTNAAFTPFLPYEIHLVTAGPASVIVTREINGTFDPGYLFFTGTGGSYYGNFGIVATFDPATDEIVEVHNYYGDPNNPATTGNASNPAGSSGPPDYWSLQGPSVRRAALDPSGINAYDGTGSNPVVDIKYFMYQTTYLGGTSPRVEIDEHWDYVGPRP